MKIELDWYLPFGVLDFKLNPLHWWNVEHHSYTILEKLDKKYLCISASSAASIMLFSSTGNVVTSKRSCLKSATVNMLLFLAKNLQQYVATFNYGVKHFNCDYIIANNRCINLCNFALFNHYS